MPRVPTESAYWVPYTSLRAAEGLLADTVPWPEAGHVYNANEQALWPVRIGNDRAGYAWRHAGPFRPQEVLLALPSSSVPHFLHPADWRRLARIPGAVALTCSPFQGGCRHVTLSHTLEDFEDHWHNLCLIRAVPPDAAEDQPPLDALLRPNVPVRIPRIPDRCAECGQPLPNGGVGVAPDRILCTNCLYASVVSAPAPASSLGAPARTFPDRCAVCFRSLPSSRVGIAGNRVICATCLYAAHQHSAGLHTP